MASEEISFLKDQVYRLNHELIKYRHHRQEILDQSETDLPSDGPPPPWFTNKSLLSPLVAEYDAHIKEQQQLIAEYEDELQRLRPEVSRLVQENERLNDRLKDSVHGQLEATGDTKETSSHPIQTDEQMMQNMQFQLDALLQVFKGPGWPGKEVAIEKWHEAEAEIDRLQGQLQVFDQNVLPGYHFKDNALLLYDAIYKYVKKYVDLYYDSNDKITGDWEIQGWGAKLVKEREKGGCGLLGVPGNGSFSSKDQLYIVLTSIIYTCSVAHASTNFPQYDEYAFPPNYPALITGKPPQDKTPLEESQIVKSLPDKPTTLDVMTVTKILSSRGTKSLGDFEVQYIFEPEAKKIVDEFREDLAEIGKVIKQRNTERNPPYTILDPDTVPNSISI